MSPNKLSWEVEISEKTGRPVRWCGQNWPYYRRLMELAFHDEAVFRIATGAMVRDPNWTQVQVAAWEDRQRTVQRVIFASVNTDLGQQLMQQTDGTSMWTYLCNRFDGTVNNQTRALTKRRLYAELEAVRCRPNSDIEGHLNNMIRLRTRLQTVGMALDDTVFSGMLVSSLPVGDRFDRLRGLVESGLDCVDTPEKIVEMSITYDKANKADQMLSRAFGSSDRTTMLGSQSKPRNGGGSGGFNKPKHSKREDTQRQREEDRKADNCFGCHKPGHARKDCPNEASGSEGRANLLSTGHTDSTAKQQAKTRCASDATKQHEQMKFTSVSAGRTTQDGASTVGMQSLEPIISTKSQEGYQPESWVFDTGANRHLVGDKRHFVEFRNLTPNERKKETVHGYNGTTAPIGVGIIDLYVNINGGHVAVRLEDVYFSPGRPNLFSQSVARKQGFKVKYDDKKGLYTLRKNRAAALQASLRPCGLWMFTTYNKFLPGKRSPKSPEAMVNYALRDGVADLQCWHERLGHLCHQHVRKMVDHGLVDDMMLRKRQFATCEACQLGKQRAKPAQKLLDRGVTERNQLVFADLLFPPKNYNCTRFKAVLVIMDAYSRYITVYPVKTKNKNDINPLLKRYITWAERQCTDCKVKTLFTDGGGEFVNDEMMTWYQASGIAHNMAPPNTSRLNMVERTHQTLTGMMKSMMKESGFPTSFWVDALHYAAYLKNRSYSSAIDRTPYQAMWGRKPDIHHVRKFGALAYVHTKVGPARHKFADNCRVGFLLGYREDVLGCKVYFPAAGTVIYGGQVTVNEKVMYNDRRGPAFEDYVHDWAVDRYHDLTSAGRQDYDLPVVGGREYDRPAIDDDEGLRDDQHPSASEDKHTSWMHREPPQLGDDIVFSRTKQPYYSDQEMCVDHSSNRDVDSAEEINTAGSRCEDEASIDDRYAASSEDWERDPETNSDQLNDYENRAVNDEDNDVEHEDEDDHDNRAVFDEDNNLEHSEEEMQSSVDESEADELSSADGSYDDDADEPEQSDDAPQLIGHRRLRDDDASVISSEAERKRTRLFVAKNDVENTSPGFSVYAAMTVTTQDNPQNRLWHESEIRLPKSFKQAMQSPQHKEWWTGMENELAAMKTKGVFELIPKEEMPSGKKRWRQCGGSKLKLIQTVTS